MTQELNDLFTTAAQDGILSPQSVHALTNDPDLGNKIQRVLGQKVAPMGTSEIIVVAAIVDDSGSIQAYGNTQHIRDGVNSVRAAIIKSKQLNNIYWSLRLLNGAVINPFMLIDNAPDLDNRNYNEASFGGTPLYDGTWDLLTGLTAETEGYRQNGFTARGVGMIVSDGYDEHSRKHRDPSAVRQLAIDLQNSEDYTIVAMGVMHGRVDFHDVFATQLGIDPKMILTSDADPSNIRRLFQVASLTAVNLSQTAGMFSQTKAGGVAQIATQLGGGFLGTATP